MTINQIAQELALKENGKSQAKMGDIKQIVSILSDMVVKDPSVIATLIANGLKRAKKKKA